MPLLGWPYVEGIGAWGENTSAYNFCEMDYYLTPYIAEFINTMTNLGYISLAYKGIARNRRNSNDSAVTACYLLLSTIGIGSGIYHAAPTYTTQMVDEIPMLCATAGILYGASSIPLGPSSRKSLAVLLTILSIAISTIHCFLGHVTIFRLTFLFLILCVLAQFVYQIYFKIPDPEVRKNAVLLTRYGAGTFLAGYALWNVDMHLCGHLASVRDVVGLPLGFVTEFHGWWHILTGFGVYYDIVAIEYLRLYMQSKTTSSQPSFKLVWTSRFTFPHIEIDAKPQSKTL